MGDDSRAAGLRLADGAQLFGLEVGDGPRRAVVLHGGPGASHDYLRPQLDALATADQVGLYYYDQRGSGRSTENAGADLGASRHIADLDEVRALRGQERLTLVGYSWGGLLALLYATRYPERVERLLLVSCAPASATWRATMKSRLAAAAMRPSVAAMRERLTAAGPLGRRERFALAVAGYFVDPERALGLTPFVVQQRVETAVWSSLADYDLTPALAALAGVPVLLVHGRDDPVPVEGAREIAAALAAAGNARLVELPDCGHVPYVEAPELLFAAATPFLALASA